MTKKDFQLIAGAIFTAPYFGQTAADSMRQRQAVAEHFAGMLAQTNPLFKRDLFIQAATGQVSVTARKGMHESS